jgi:hypothetical protein
VGLDSISILLSVSAFGGFGLCLLLVVTFSLTPFVTHFVRAIRFAHHSCCFLFFFVVSIHRPFPPSAVPGRVFGSSFLYPPFITNKVSL